MIGCSWKKNFGIDCPSCGAQRAFLELLHGNMNEAMLLFPALPFLLLVFILVIYTILTKRTNFLKTIVFLFGFSAYLMIATTLMKVSNQ